jgi:hypothetical protein
MRAWDFLVGLGDLSRTEVRPAAEITAMDLADGEVLLEVERFSFTANNITYGVFGDRMGYWRFFPAPDGWGRIPVWGFARVAASRAQGVEVGTRLYGYLPMSTHMVARLRPSGTGYRDQSEHRAALPGAYNRYETAPETSRDDELALLRPLFTTSFLLDDYLGEIAPDATVILSSGSSRTALGLAWLLARRCAAGVALTSARNVGFVQGLGLYDQVVEYGSIAGLQIDGPVAFVDMAGDAAVRGAVHRRFSDRLVHSAVVGSTHHQAPAVDAGGMLPGSAPTFFFAPDRLTARHQDWGAAVLGQRIDEAMANFVEDSRWLTVERHYGPDALGRVYAAVLTGAAVSDIGYIVLPGTLSRAPSARQGGRIGRSGLSNQRDAD